MTFPQQECLQKLGSNKLCIDSTHGTNGYGLQLTTLMTIAEDGSGIPCAYLISKSIDTNTMVKFFEAIRERVGKIECEAFMSDDAQQYGNAWEQVMGTPKRRLLCSWHVLRNWNTRLTKITSVRLKNEIRKTLRTLMDCAEIEKFEEMFSQFLKRLEDACKQPGPEEDSEQEGRLTPEQKCALEEFRSYFVKTYSTRVRQWAFCYRKEVNLSTNNHIESMHRTLKCTHMHGKQNYRLDKLIWLLFTMTSDVFIKRVIRLVKGKTDHRRTALAKKHRAGLNFPESDITKVGEGQWLIRAQTLSQYNYKLERTSETCAGCHLHCTSCQACHIMYRCSCLDHVMHNHMCKHIHAVASRELQSHKLPVNEDSQANHSNCGSITNSMVDDPGSLFASVQEGIFGAMQGVQPVTSAKLRDSLKIEFEAVFRTLVKKLPDTPDDECQTMLTDLRKYAAKHKLAVSDKPGKKIPRLEPPNKKMQKQPRYGAPKRSAKAAFGQPPTILEKEAIEQQLLSQEPQAGIQFIHTGFDHNY
ncbi:uncharacterized protein LOC144153997 [Haemaphysalis longicornis]